VLDDFIDTYIELKMTEVERFEMTPHPVEFDNVLFAVIGLRVSRNRHRKRKKGAPKGAPFLLSAMK